MQLKMANDSARSRAALQQSCWLPSPTLVNPDSPAQRCTARCSLEIFSLDQSDRHAKITGLRTVFEAATALQA